MRRKNIETSFFSLKKNMKSLVKNGGLSVVDDKIDTLNNYIGSTGKKYKSHYHTILSWDRRNSNGSNGQTTKTNSRQRQGQIDFSAQKSALGTSFSNLDGRVSRKCYRVECGKAPRMSAWVELFGRYVHSKWCPACDAVQSKKAAMKRENEKSLKIGRLIARFIPELYQDAQLAHIPQDILAHVQSKQPGQGIYIWGDVGRGKTYMASALMRQCIEQGKMVRRAALKDIIDKIQGTFDSYGSAEMIYQQFIQANLLCLEDIGTGKDGGMQSDFNQDVLLKLVDRRIEAKKTTIITSNLEPREYMQCFRDSDL